ncbi:MAG: outer membrane lipoprotein carrier protein LolA [Bacteroidales bacterium]|nr:outer membrane lipoprotein carrier protein LolA [Bacteroidales bacterium]
MKKIITIFLTIFAFLSVNAQKDKKATEILNKVIENTESYETIKVDFTYKMYNEEANIDESKDGKLYIQKQKYRLLIANQMIISDGETIWTYLKSDQEVMISSADESEETINPSNLLNSYNEDYKSKFIKETIIDGKQIEIIELKPLKGKTYSLIEVTIDKAKKQILVFTIFDKNGSEYSYQIKEFIPNIPLSDTTFTFLEKDYPDVDFIDMRF